MGFYKNLQDSQSPHGFLYTGSKYVCPDCFSDYAIQSFIQDNADEEICSYCATKSEAPIAADLSEVIKFIMKGIISEYSNPYDENMEYDSDEGGYLGEVYHTSDIFEDEIAPLIENENLISDISGSLTDTYWCRKDYYWLPEHQKLIFNWDQFSEQVKHKTRYVFLRLPAKSSEYVLEDPDEIPTREMLNRLGRVLSETNLCRTFDPGHIFHRVRVHKREEICNDVEGCGPPLPEEVMTSGRMSPAGIAMFYGALDEKTALIETHDPNKEVITCSKWKSLHILRFLDLTNIPDLPSIFDPERRIERPNIRFLWSFKEDLVKPPHKDKFEHVDYVPTQVFTEYIRYLYSNPHGDSFDAILYPSRKHPAHTNCVIFCERQNCVGIHEDIDDKSHVTKYLRLVECKDIDNTEYRDYLSSL